MTRTATFMFFAIFKSRKYTLMCFYISRKNSPKNAFLKTIFAFLRQKNRLKVFRIHRSKFRFPLPRNG